MLPKYYNPARTDSHPVEIPFGAVHGLLDPRHYLPPPGLVDAANVAIILGQPLLLTGEPGTGKTRFAYHLSHALGWGEPLVFEAKSTSTARDVFYTYDHLNDFRDAHRGSPFQPGRYITLNALGLAILLTKAADHPDVSAFWPAPGPKQPAFSGPRRSVVLIDEIDKAPRDVPNDILNELELLYFRIQECGNQRIEADEKMRPLVVLTSNSEKQLPEPFLRRCVYFDIPFPTDDELAEIVTARITGLRRSDPLLTNAIEFFTHVRSQPRLRKKPGTAELLGWVSVLLAMGVPVQAGLAEQRAAMAETVGTLMKTREDQHLLAASLEEWLQVSPQPVGRG